MQAVDGKTVHLPQEWSRASYRLLHLQLALHIGFPNAREVLSISFFTGMVS